MIFATVGTQLPFPRLIEALDRIAAAHGLEIVCQTNDVSADARFIEHRPNFTPGAFDAIVQKARILVGHAGVGTVLAAKKFGKPVIIFPRRASLGEHRNEHQLATAQSLGGIQGIHIAWDEGLLEKFLTSSSLEIPSGGASKTGSQLVNRLRGFILES